MERVKFQTNTINLEAEGEKAMKWAESVIEKVTTPAVMFQKLGIHNPHTFLEDLSTAKIGDYIIAELTYGRKARFDVTDIGDGWIRFDSRDCLGCTVWNENGKTSGGVAESDLQHYLNEDMVELLPEYLKTRIINTKRKYMDGDQEKEYTTALFVPDESELFDDNLYGAKLYDQLEYYKDRRNRMKGEIPGEDTTRWWLASAVGDSSSAALYVNNYGHSNRNGASGSLYVPVCFRIATQSR